MRREEFKIEICANSVDSCVAAQNGGADRVELCAGIPEGGTTPSVGMIREARNSICMGLNVIIRPRGGDFLYNESEIRQMEYDIRTAVDEGADGLVMGMLTADGEVDLRLCERLLKLCGGLPVTFHRAFDCVRDPFAALEDVVSLGFARILTSGCAATAPEGTDVIARLVDQASGRISIMAGCGVREDNIAALAKVTGAREFHFSARETVPSKMRFAAPEAVRMGSEQETILRTTPQRVAATIDKLLY